ncbi:DNA polymerase III subunit epsilon [Erythrobacter sp. NFXS35]|uniref:3'-5' exonuclease n=1 Tax=Erythrobacter sp. NFXS35 TaxID=2818436 RepID=UPI0032DF3810
MRICRGETGRRREKSEGKKSQNGSAFAAPVSPTRNWRNHTMTIQHTHLDPVSEVLADRLSEYPDYRVLRSLPPPYASMPASGAPPEGRCIALLDVETTSLDAAAGSIIELAIKLLWVDDDGNLLGHFPIFSWMQDPGHPLDGKIAQLTGLTDADLAGKTIDDEAVGRLLDRADLIVAHNARFDLEWILQRWPDLWEKPWACSCHEISWQPLGLEGRSQPFLLQQHGWFARAHRAPADVWALFWLLQQSRTEPDSDNSDEGGASTGTERTHLQRLLAASDRATVRVEAAGAPFARKDLLRARGYRWDAELLRKVWWCEIASEDVEAEQLWFNRNDLPAPRLVPITAHERHR